MVIQHVCGIEWQMLVVHGAYCVDDFLFVPYDALSHFFRVKSRCTQSSIPITKDPDALLIQLRVIVLEVSGKDVAFVFVDLLHGSDPLALAVRVITTARTLENAKVLRGRPVGPRPNSSILVSRLGSLLGRWLTIITR